MIVGMPHLNEPVIAWYSGMAKYGITLYRLDGISTDAAEHLLRFVDPLGYAVAVFYTGVYFPYTKHLQGGYCLGSLWDRLMAERWQLEPLYYECRDDFYDGTAQFRALSDEAQAVMLSVPQQEHLEGPEGRYDAGA